MTYTNELYHHGIKGQKWGVRRYQNKDGSYTEEGKQRRSKYRSESTISVNSSSGSYGNSKWTGKRVLIERSGTKNTVKKNALDKAAEVDDYDKMNGVDRIGSNAISVYTKSGAEAVRKYLDSELKDYDYQYALDDVREEYGEDVVSKIVDEYKNFTLRVFGNDYQYTTYGDENYSDDQYFTKRKNGG